ncbi:MAG: OmpA family protein [Cytophagaceae bacterium]
MRILSFLFLALFISFINSIHAQQAIIFSDDFENGLVQWQSADAASCKPVNQAGKMLLKNHGEQEIVVSSAARIYPRQDFEISFTLHNSSSSHSGLLIGDLGGSDFFIFSLSPDKETSLIHLKGREKSTLSSSTEKFPSVQEDVNIRITKAGTTWTFFVNEIKHISFSGTFPGKQLGFYLSPGDQLVLDDMLISWTNKTINLAENHPNYGERQLLTGVNSEFNELSPVMNKESDKLYFVRKGVQGESQTQNVNDDIYFSNVSSSSFSSAIKPSGSVNDQNHNAVSGSVSKDDHLLIVKQASGKNKKIKDNYYITKVSAGEFKAPELQKIANYKNDWPFISASLSPNGKVMVLAIQKQGGQGESDLYVSFLQSGNKWSEPKNMGSAINTFGMEMTPYIAADNRTLYFSSDGHGGFGSVDVYVSKRKSDDWNDWTEPQNLGPNVNSSMWDAYFSIDSKEEFGYYCSLFQSKGGTDIARIALPKKEALLETMTLKGYVYDTLTMQPLDAMIYLRELHADTLIGQVLTDASTGYFEFQIKRSVEYNILAEKQYYNADKKNVEPGVVKANVVQQNMYLKKFAPGQRINLNMIYFEQSKPVILAHSYPELQKLVKILEENPSLKIQIEGHTDNQGGADANMKLSEQRAEAIKKYLIDNGVDGSRLSSIGYGQTRPRVSNVSAKTRKFNRRVEFLILQ